MNICLSIFVLQFIIMRISFFLFLFCNEYSYGGGGGGCIYNLFYICTRVLYMGFVPENKLIRIRKASNENMI